MWIILKKTMKKSDRIKVWAKYNRRCAYCGKNIEYKDMQVDHLLPLMRTEVGTSIFGEKIEKELNNFSNLMPSCRRCNHYKRANSLETFRELLKTIHQRLKDIYIFKVAVDYGVVKIQPFDGEFYYEKYEKEYAGQGFLFDAREYISDEIIKELTKDE